MNRMIKSFGAVALYLLLLCFLLKTEAVLLFSPRHIGMFFLGCIILCIPHLEKGFTWKDLKEIFCRNAVTVGYLEAFMLLFASLNGGGVPEEKIVTELALDLRPLFYGFVCYVVLRGEEGQEKSSAGSGQEEETVREEEKTAASDQEKGAVPGNKDGTASAQTAERSGESDSLLGKGLLGDQPGEGKKPDPGLLTRQERQVALLAARGLTNRQIGEELCISEATVKKHMSNIFEKLEIGSRKELRQLFM